jgi:hypothetical protein
MQIMNFFKTNKYFFTKNTHFLTINPFFSRIIVDFFVLIVYFFTTIVHFSKMIDNFLVDNSQNPDMIDKKQIAFVQATTPIPSPSGTFASPQEPTLQPKACKRACQPIPLQHTKIGQHFD